VKALFMAAMGGFVPRGPETEGIQENME